MDTVNQAAAASLAHMSIRLGCYWDVNYSFIIYQLVISFLPFDSVFQLSYREAMCLGRACAESTIPENIKIFLIQNPPKMTS